MDTYPKMAVRDGAHWTDTVQGTGEQRKCVPQTSQVASSKQCTTTELGPRSHELVAKAQWLCAGRCHPKSSDPVEVRESAGQQLAHFGFSVQDPSKTEAAKKDFFGCFVIG